MLPSIRLCITGTDTDAGKSLVTAGLALASRRMGLVPRMLKPVQTGCLPGTGEDAPVASPAAPNVAPDVTLFRRLCPGAEAEALTLLRDACSPHLAARRENTVLRARDLATRTLQKADAAQADVLLVEGAGGLMTPLNEKEHLLDFFALLCGMQPGWRMLLVVGNRLGAVNHALLTLEALRARGLEPAGFILTASSPVDAQEGDAALAEAIRADNKDILERMGRVPCLADIPYIPGLGDEAVPDASLQQLTEALLPAARRLFPPDGATSSLSSARSSEEDEALLRFDREHIWHPYTSALHPLTAREAVRTEGTRIILRDGKALIDGMASWWCAIHGYRHPVLMRALTEQAGRMPHVMFGGLTHEAAVGLARRLLDMAPKGLGHVFFADSGSVSVEAAMKMALQYQQARGLSGKNRLLTVRGGYHGDTLGAMSVCDPENGMHSLFSGMLAQQVFAPRPECRFDAPFDPADAAGLERAFAEHGHKAAALILEPVVQGAGGMWFYHPGYLQRARELCDEHGCLLILDEIATGFGRTGRLFACEWAGVAPDIMCVGKALTGGMMTLAATLASRDVAMTISADTRGHGGVFMHGPTFMANPLACAVAGASLDLLAEGRWRADVARIEQMLTRELLPCGELPGVADARVLGAIGVLEMRGPVNVEALQRFFVEECGVWIRPFARLVYIMPPYVTTDDELTRLCAAMRAAVEKGLWR